MELIFDAVQILQTRPKNDDIEIIIPNRSEPITISTIIYNIIILVCILQLLNNKVWLADSGLIDSDTNKFIPLLLFTINTVSKFIFKANKYVTYDYFLTLKITSILCNFFMIGIIGTSLYNINNNKDDEGYPDFIYCNFFYKYISKKISSPLINIFYLYPSLLQMIPLSYIIHSLNDKYYIKNRDSNHYVNSFDGGIIMFLIVEFIILAIIYPRFRDIDKDSEFFEFKGYEFLQLFKSVRVKFNETNKDKDRKCQVINITSENIYSFGFNTFLTSILVSLISYPILHIINNGINATNGLLLCAHIFFCLIFLSSTITPSRKYTIRLHILAMSDS